jgi:ABC-type nickel/cobalt efflux system permease component RcnA
LNSDCRSRLILFGLLLLLPLCTVHANPFLGAAEEPAAQVASSGPTPEGLAEKQLDLRNRMADLLLSLKEGHSSRLLMILYALSFFYGGLHASGPGHRKTIVFSLFLSREARIWEPLGFGFLLALLHGGSAVLLILFYKSTAGPLLSRNLNAATLQMEGWAYTLLLVLSLFLLAGAIRHAAKGHTHKEAGKRSLMAIALTGFFPCPGAIMILIFTLTQDMLGMGISSVLIMSAGMAIPISLAGYLAYFGKKGVFTALKNREKILHKAASAMEMAGYSFLLIFSFVMALPFLRGMIQI